jgi:DNA replication protein DnaC
MNKSFASTSSMAEHMQQRLAELARSAPKAPSATCGLCDDMKWIVENGFARRCSCAGGPTDVGAPSTPLEFRSAFLSNFDAVRGTSSAIAAGYDWLDGKRDLYLHGGVGGGKTRLACSLLNEFYRKYRAGMFARVSGMLFSLQPKEDGSHDRLWTRLLENPVLVLDDVGAEREDASDFSRRTVLLLYEERGDRGYRTIWTSNKSLNELSDQMGDDRLVSRIAGRSDVVKVTADDQRVRRRRG